MTRGRFGPLCTSTILGYSCYSSAICGVIHGLLYLYSLQVWIFANWNNFGCYRCCKEILVTFANFAKLADHKKSPRYLYSVAKFVILATFVSFFFLTQSFHTARKILVTFAIFAKFADFTKPFLTFCLSNCRILLNLLFLLFLPYLSLNLFTQQGKVLLLLRFCKICGLHEAILDLFSF